MTFGEACALVETALSGSFRREVVERAAATGDARRALGDIRDQMRSHRWISGSTTIALDGLVREFDDRTRREGFHVLHDWDGKADHVNPDTIAVDVATFLVDRTKAEAPDPRTLAILIDYYFVYLLSLLIVRIWDGDDADADCERLGRVFDRLQGPDGSGERFVDDVESLMLIAGSHFERDDTVYDRLLARVRTLSLPRRRRIAMTHSASLGCHLRFGIEATYNSDFGLMRDDNRVDYSWLCFSLATLIDDWDERRRDGDALGATALAEAIAGGLSSDADAYLRERTPKVLAADEVERRQFRERFGSNLVALTEAVAPFRPVDGTYSAMSLFFNFSQNVLKGAVVDAALWGEPRRLSLNDLLTGLPADSDLSGRKLRLLGMLMGFARANPDRIRGTLMPVIVYDVLAGRRAFGSMTRAMKAM